MSAESAVRSAHRGDHSLAERAGAILRDEIANGALANIGVATERWAGVRRALGSPTPTPIAQADELLRAVLDLIAPAADDPAPPQPVLALRAPDHVEPGGSAVVTLAVQNDRSVDVEISFTWSDLVAPSNRRIAADRIRLIPPRVRIPVGRSAELAVVLDTPASALSGLYRALIQATDNLDLLAVLTFPVGGSA